MKARLVGLIQWWCSCFARTGDRQCLEWAQKLADKWYASQDAETGLVPYTLPWKRKPSNPNTRGGAKFAVALLKAAKEIREYPDGEALADQLSRMGVKLARGIARYGYDIEAARFHESLRMDGTPIATANPEFFSSEEEKAAFVNEDPAASMVPVFANGESFYLQGPYWRLYHRYQNSI